MTQLWRFKKDILIRQQSTVLVSACNRAAADTSVARVAGMLIREGSTFTAEVDARQRMHLMAAHEKLSLTRAPDYRGQRMHWLPWNGIECVSL